jgi:uridine kinase
MLELGKPIDLLLSKRQALPAQHALLAGVSGIDGSGKGYVTARILAILQQRGHAAVAISGDTWLRLPRERFDPQRPAEHFYEHAFRFEEMFEHLILPLQRDRAVDLIADGADPTNAEQYRPYPYHFRDVDIVLLEAVYLFKRTFRAVFDLAFWVDCTFETALERALERGQEGLSRAQTVHDYETIYFPAQRIHLARDGPRASADCVIPNDPRLAVSG